LNDEKARKLERATPSPDVQRQLIAGQLRSGSLALSDAELAAHFGSALAAQILGAAQSARPNQGTEVRAWLSPLRRRPDLALAAALSVAKIAIGSSPHPLVQAALELAESPPDEQVVLSRAEELLRELRSRDQVMGSSWKECFGAETLLQCVLRPEACLNKIAYLVNSCSDFDAALESLIDSATPEPFSRLRIDPPDPAAR